LIVVHLLVHQAQPFGKASNPRCDSSAVLIPAQLLLRCQTVLVAF
jgi:hypothetical protein